MKILIKYYILSHFINVYTVLQSDFQQCDILTSVLRLASAASF